tara:strand:- start:56 stop:430 length:375 start_codon:yes stop_codon:yes gene_type:complete
MNEKQEEYLEKAGWVRSNNYTNEGEEIPYYFNSEGRRLTPVSHSGHVTKPTARAHFSQLLKIIDDQISKEHTHHEHHHGGSRIKRSKRKRKIKKSKRKSSKKLRKSSKKIRKSTKKISKSRRRR